MNETSENKCSCGGITAGTVARAVCLLLALVNQVLSVLGYSPLPIQDDTVTMLVSTLATIAAAACGWWKNNSVTKSALAADETLRALKQHAKGADAS